MSSMTEATLQKLPPGTELSIESSRELIDDEDGWKLAHVGKTLRVWTRPSSKCDFHAIKTTATFNDIPSSVAYAVLHDMNYRKKWDKFFLFAETVGRIDSNSDVCHYAVKSPPPFKNRDFVLHRLWRDDEAEKWILGMCGVLAAETHSCSTNVLARSICHKGVPPSKQLVRGVTYITVFHIRPVEQGCQLTYITDSDPRGKFPPWVTNHVTKLVIPKLIKKLRNACRRYDDWKGKHPLPADQQPATPLIEPLDCSACSDDKSPTVDESLLEPATMQDSGSDNS